MAVKTNGGVKVDLFKEARVQLKGTVFDLKEVYTHAHDWLEWRKYKVIEKKYKEKVTQAGREIKTEWEARRDIDEYTRFEIDVRWECYGVNDVVVEYAGKKLKLQKGEVNVYVTTYLVLDYEEKWELSPVLKFLKGFFEKYLYAGTLNRLQNELWKEGWEFYNEIKAFLNLYRYEIKYPPE